MMIKGGENRAVHFDFGWSRASRFKNTVHPAVTQIPSVESVSLRRLVGVARGPLRCRARLEGIGPIG